MIVSKKKGIEALFATVVVIALLMALITIVFSLSSELMEESTGDKVHPPVQPEQVLEGSYDPTANITEY
ncbi:MAG: hypothetical protein KJ709_03870 [Nanoarchaeota archaeon]|nr:hypothetical protein [Nanoarchaeota archaeon]